MFRIGEFSKIAQVSGRLLRYYDEIGLLQPAHTDPETGYRYYMANQIPRLNRILALKELGLSLDQISRMLDDDISPDEIRGMLMMKQAQVEQTLRDEISRLRYIESRIKQIDAEGALEDFDIVLKEVPAQRMLSVREVCPTFPDGRKLLLEMVRVLPSKVGKKKLGHIMAVIYSEFFEYENIDLDIGFQLTEDFDEDVTLPSGVTMTVTELPAVQTMLTVTRVGPLEVAVGGYNSLGLWMDAHGYEIDGQGREIFIRPGLPGQEAEAVTEVQFPVKKIESNLSFADLS